ncbi:MAG: baseplate J/gp47 family protein, partial [Chloroflexota bacterium]|nr:baseplate J/gp47 family protein [Chloroflexota bacterium]
ISPRTVALAIGALALTGVVLLAVGYFLLSSATVTITPVTRPASADLEYAIVPPDTDPPANVLVVPGERVSLDFSVEASQATTGTRAEPAGEARGRVRFSNPNDEDIDIAAGTSLETEAGQAYAVDEDLTIPAGDPGLGRYGSAEASVTAEDPGTGGNIEIGGLSGRLENGVYFSNRDAPLADGTDREVPVVAAGDVQALRETATVALREKITAEVDQSTPDGVTIVPESIAEDDLTFSFSGQAGDEAETLSVTASAPVTVLTYRPAETETAILADATTRLTAGAPAGFQFDPASLQLAAPVLVEADGSGARYTVTGSGRWVALISDADRDRLADQLAGSDAGEADRILSSVPSIEGSEVDYGPGWLPDRMPPSAGRISIAVDD